MVTPATKLIKFTGFDGAKYELSKIPASAKIYLETLTDKEDGQVRQLVIKDGEQTLATFSSIVSFFESSLEFKAFDKSKEFI